MRIPLTLLAVLALVATAGHAPAQESEPGPAVPEIVSSASAERSAPADLAVVSVRFHRSGPTPAAAGRGIALKADSIRRALAPLGIAPDSIINGSRWYWWRERIEVVETRRSIERWVEQPGGRFRADSVVVDTTFRAHESLQVRIREMSRVGAVIDALLAQRITDISEIAFSATNAERAQREAIREATEWARARAETIAAAGGARLGRTLRLSTEGPGAPARYRLYDALSLDGAGVTSSGPDRGETVVVAPVVRVTATVHGRWELVEDRAAAPSVPVRPRG